MLPLLERVVSHLERVKRVESKDITDRHERLDYGRFEAFVLERFEEVAHRYAAQLDPSRWRWTPDYLRSFVDELYWGLLDGVGARWSFSVRVELVEAGLLSASMLDGHKNERLSLPRVRLLESLVRTAEQQIGHSEASWPNQAQWNVATRYCDRLGLTREQDVGIELAPAGSTLVRLRGLDRLRWLLAVETSLATSADDPWCVDLDSVRYLAQDKEWTFTPSDPEGWPISDSTFDRWTALGALKYWEDDDYEGVYGYKRTRIGLELFGELARDDSTSFRTLARAFLVDEREQVFTSSPDPGSAQDRAAAATLNHARMVAHEVRNALFPVQHWLPKIWSNPEVAKADLGEPRRRIEEGLARLHRFINDSLRLTPMTTEEATRFSVMEVIDEARQRCVPSPKGGILIETLPASANPKCRGHQGRLVLALLNLLRNAVQVGGEEVRVQIYVDARVPGTVTISVRDNGPGVPEAQQAMLFDNGVSHRDGGSGHGLSLVRRIVEDEMGGEIRLISSPERQPGACFELDIPTEEDTQ